MRNARIKVNVPNAMAAPLRDRIGIGAPPTLTIRSEFKPGSLMRVVPDYHLQLLNICAVDAWREYLDAKIRT
jgi:hypothetical protein